MISWGCNNHSGFRVAIQGLGRHGTRKVDATSNVGSFDRGKQKAANRIQRDYAAESIRPEKMERMTASPRAKSDR